MCEITRGNFEDKWPEVENSIKTASFIAIDSEFSGLQSCNSLFDDPQKRYIKLRENIDPFIILQIGVTTFHFSRDENAYQGNTFCFYLFPRTFSSIDVQFKSLASSFEFLCQHEFDFNKCAYHGVSYLNEDQDIKVQQDLKEGRLFRLVERSLSFSDERTVQALCSQVALWLAGGKQAEGNSENSILLQIPQDSESSQCISYIVHHELRRRFVSVWTRPEGRNIRVLKVSLAERAMLKQNDSHEEQLRDEVLSAVRGFTRVFHLLADAKKPIVGHNLMLDLMIMYKQFLKSLPKVYEDFKTCIHAIFPHVYDTKYMSLELRTRISRKECWESNSLEALFKYFKGERGLHLAPCSPVIKSVQYVEKEFGKFHNAGWDSFCTGYCFIRLAHFFASASRGSLSHATPLTSTEHLELTSGMRNRVNMIRGNVTHFVLDGSDPPSKRPELIVVQTRNGQNLDVLDLTEQLARLGNVDVKRLSASQALVAASMKSIVNSISREYYLHRDLKVVKYSQVRHNRMLWYSVCGGAGLLGGLCTYLLYRSAFSNA